MVGELSEGHSIQSNTTIAGVGGNGTYNIEGSAAHTKPWGKFYLWTGREGPLSQTEQIKINVPSTVDTSTGDTTAKLKQQTIAMATKVMIDVESSLGI